MMIRDITAFTCRSDTSTIGYEYYIGVVDQYRTATGFYINKKTCHNYGWALNAIFPLYNPFITREMCESFSISGTLHITSVIGYTSHM